MSIQTLMGLDKLKEAVRPTKKLIGLMPVRNEDWCLGLTMRVALLWCDELIVLDHGSTDASMRIEMDVAAENPGRVTLLADDNTMIWDEMRHRQWMLETARKRGASHIAIIDADEFVTSDVVTRMAGLVKSLVPGFMMQIPLYNVRGGLECFHGNGVWSHRIVSVAFADSLQARWSGDRFHAREPLQYFIANMPILQGHGGVIHLWGYDERRLKAKHALYKIVERLRWPDKPVVVIDAMYSLAILGDEYVPASKWEFEKTPAAWYATYKNWLREFLHDEEDNRPPWQELEVKTIYCADPKRFKGLNLFGVVDR